jgi:hypothetical protein
MPRKWCIPLAGLALIIGSLAATAPAAAARQAAHKPATGHLAPGTGPMIPAGFPHGVARSQNWSGYAAHHGTYRSVSASWVEPAGHCGRKRTFSAFWVGLDGYSSHTVEQTGSEVDCSGGRPRYFAWYEMFPADPVTFRSRVQPGDHLTGSVSHTHGDHYILVLKDTTAHWSHTVRRTLRSARNSSAEVITEAPCCTSAGGVLPLTDFGTVHFGGAEVNGHPIGRTRPTKIVMFDPSGRAKDAVSGLHRGKKFKVTFRHST